MSGDPDPGGEYGKIPLEASPWIHQIDGLSVVMLDDAGKDSTDGITNITSPRFEIPARRNRCRA